MADACIHYCDASFCPRGREEEPEINLSQRGVDESFRGVGVVGIVVVFTIRLSYCRGSYAQDSLAVFVHFSHGRRSERTLPPGVACYM